MDDEIRSSDDWTDEQPALRSKLHTWERWVAGVFGFAGVCVGGVAIFVSTNQAGTTAILALGAIFVLLAVQGTAIRKASKNSVELDPRDAVGRTLVKANDFYQEKGPSEARAIIEGAATARPEIKNDAAFQIAGSVWYEEQARDALRRGLARASDSEARIELNPVIEGEHFDAEVIFPDKPDKRILVEALYTTRKWADERHVEPAKSRMQKLVGVALLCRTST